MSGPIDLPNDPFRTYPVINTEEGLRTWAFGELWPVQNDIALHLNCFRLGREGVPGSMGKLRHLVEAHNLIWPKQREFLHEWTIERFAEFCRGTREVVLAGGSSTGKSSDVAKYALLWWWANPEERAVLICSTTILALRRRIWAYLVEGSHLAEGKLPGKITTSPVPKITYPRMGENGKNWIDERHLILAAALKEGDTKRTLSELIGYHPVDGLLVVIDEATDVTPAVLQAITNWDNGNPGKFQLIALGNSCSRSDVHGILSKPKGGWSSVHPDTHKRWETERGGVCLYFDCYKSPAIHAKNKKALAKFLMNAAKIEMAEKQQGKDSSEFWRFTRGFWPAEDSVATVLSENEIEKGNARGRITWGGKGVVAVAACDPAYSTGGDRCILQFGQFGMSMSGREILEYGDTVVIPLDAQSREPLSYQIVSSCRVECQKRGVDPINFGIDTNGWGAGAGDILQKEWSYEIHRIINQGKSTSRQVDAQMTVREGEMARTASEVYVDMGTEMWFAVKMFVLSGQLKGMTDPAVEQFCTRIWQWKSRRMMLEPKPDYKKRMGKENQPTGSPDEADAKAMCLEVARRAGFDLDGGHVPDYVREQEKTRWQDQWELTRGVVARMEDEVEGEDRWQDAIANSISFGESSWED